MKKVITSVCAVVCLVACLSAQNVTVTDAIGMSPTAFLKQYLTNGNGIYLFNVKFQNSASNITSRAVGTFDANGFEDLGMQKGIIMTTGDISVAEGPNNSSGAGMQLTPYYTDKTMNALDNSGNGVTSCSTFDFDFVTLSSYLSFNYCFGSEEYQNYTCSSFNDIFGFLLTGPDPETGEEVTINMAIIPGTKTEANPSGIPVSVNSVNDGTHADNPSIGCYDDYSAYFINNYFNYGSDEMDGVQYEGYTDKLVAEAAVTPCAVYHMHISVCNVADQALDSGVFIEGGSLTTPSNETGLANPTLDTVKGGCPLYRTIDLSAAKFDQATVHFTYSGTAVQGVDYAVFDEDDNIIDSNAFELTKEPRSFILKGLPKGNLSTAKTIDLVLNTQFCPEFPQLIVQDTQRFVIIRGGDVKVSDTTINCAEACFEVSVPLVYGENVSYMWQNMDGTVATGVDNPYAQTSSAMIFEDRDFRLIATGGSGCNSDTAYVHVRVNTKDIPVNIDEAEAGQTRIYPNPANEVINIEAEGLQKVEIFSVEGRLVLSRDYAGQNGTVAIPTEGLENGVYGIRVSTLNGKTGAKVVVNK